MPYMAMLGKLFKQPTRCVALDAPHDFAGRHVLWSTHQNANVILAHHTLDDAYLERRTHLPHQLSNIVFIGRLQRSHYLRLKTGFFNHCASRWTTNTKHTLNSSDAESLKIGFQYFLFFLLTVLFFRIYYATASTRLAYILPSFIRGIAILYNIFTLA